MILCIIVNQKVTNREISHEQISKMEEKPWQQKGVGAGGVAPSPPPPPMGRECNPIIWLDYGSTDGTREGSTII